MADRGENPFAGPIGRDLADECTQFGGVIVEWLRDKLNVPVEYITGPRGGTIVIRSKPGEYPRRETGDLQSGMFSDVTIDGDRIELLIDDPVHYGEPLQLNLARLIFNDVESNFADEFADRVASRINRE